MICMHTGIIYPTKILAAGCVHPQDRNPSTHPKRPLHHGLELPAR